MKVRFLPAPDVDERQLRDLVAVLLDGFTPAPGQRLVSTDELIQLATASLDKAHVELIRRSRVQVELEGEISRVHR